MRSLDEAGDPGLKRIMPEDKPGSSEWLILSAVVIGVPNEGNVVPWVKEIISKLNATTVKALLSPEVKQAMANVGADVVGNTPEQFTAFIAAERTKYAKIVKDGNIRMD